MWQCATAVRESRNQSSKRAFRCLYFECVRPKPLGWVGGWYLQVRTISFKKYPFNDAPILLMHLIQLSTFTPDTPSLHIPPTECNLGVYGQGSPPDQSMPSGKIVMW